MKNLILILTISILTSCGQGINVEKGIDSELLSYVEYAEDMLDVRVEYAVRFAKEGELDSEKTAGVCKSTKGVSTKVLINKTFWEESNEARRELLVLHEIGHCSLDLDHTHEAGDDYVTLNFDDVGGCPESIMTPFISNNYQAEKCFEDNKDFYLDEILERAGE